MYITYGTPSGGEVTEKRLSYVCSAASGQSDGTDCAQAIFDELTGSISAEPDELPDPIWLYHNGNFDLDCDGLAEYLKAHFEMLGLGEVNRVWCQPKPDGNHFRRDTQPPNPGYYPSYFFWRNVHVHDKQVNGSSEMLLLWDYDGIEHNYEAAIEYDGKLYALGIGSGYDDNTNGVRSLLNDYFDINWGYIHKGSLWGDDYWAPCDIVPWVDPLE